MNTKKNIPLKIVLVLGGLYIIGSGLNIALGGIATMGWGSQHGFVSATNVHDYLIQDSHVRFVGGVWTGIGLFVLYSISDLARYRPYLFLCCALIFFGGLCRLSEGRPDVTFSSPILYSFCAELIGVPLLCWWLYRSLAK